MLAEGDKTPFSNKGTAMRVPPRRSSASVTNDEMNRLSVATLNVKFDGDSARPVPIPPSGVIPPSKRGLFSGMYEQLPWAERRSRMVDALLGLGDLDIIGFQEVLHNQLLDFQELLGPQYSHVGVGRDDGKQAGEYSPIFFRNTHFKLVDWTTKWLSTEPDTPGSISWGAAQTRIVTIATLSHRSSGQLLHVANTHYDHQSEQARANSSLLIRRLVLDWVKHQERDAGESAQGLVVLMGDLNSPPEERGYKTLVNPESTSKAETFYFLDSFTNLGTRGHGSPRPSQSAPFGPAFTFTDFKPPGYHDAKRIDFIMLAARDVIPPNGGKAHSDSARGGWATTRYACADNFVEGDSSGWTGRFSDHRIVTTVFEKL